LANPDLKPAEPIPQPSDDPKIEEQLDRITKHFEDAKTSAFTSARDILGERFDPTNSGLLSDLEKNIGRALERAGRPQDLPSAARLGSLRQITPEQFDAAESKIQNILVEGQALDELAKNPSTAARIRLYARVATWIADHPDMEGGHDACVVCGASLQEARDPVTGHLVREHLHDAMSDAALLSQTLARWAENAQGDLIRGLPEALRAEMGMEPAAHPCDLLRTAIINELFEFDPFKGVLGELKAQTAFAFDDVVKSRAAVAEPRNIALPKDCDKLDDTLGQLDRAIRFARWRQENDPLAREIVIRVLGRSNREDGTGETATPYWKTRQP